MAVHGEVLAAALRICTERGAWSFSVREIVAALPHLNARTVRTHVVSRCCVDAPKHHPHKWNYFRRVGRGTYSILPAYRVHRKRSGIVSASRVAEPSAGFRESEALRDRIHAVVHKEKGFYVAECLEIAVVTQGRTMDEVFFNLKEAIALHLDGEDLESLGLLENPRVVVTCELRLDNASPA